MGADEPFEEAAMSLELNYRRPPGQGPVIKTVSMPIYPELTVTLNGCEISLEDFLAFVRVVFRSPYNGIQAEQRDEFVRRLLNLHRVPGHNSAHDPFCTRLGTKRKGDYERNFWHDFPFGGEDHQDDPIILALCGVEFCMMDFLAAVHYVFTNTDIEARDLRIPFLKRLQQQQVEEKVKV